MPRISKVPFTKPQSPSWQMEFQLESQKSLSSSAISRIKTIINLQHFSGLSITTEGPSAILVRLPSPHLLNMEDHGQMNVITVSC